MTGATRPPSTLFGVPLALESNDARQLHDDLAGIWFAIAGRAHGNLQDDVDLLATYWHPRLRGATIRERLSRLVAPTSIPTSLYLSDSLACWIDDERALITLEGYLVLRAIPDTSAPTVIFPTTLVSAAYAAAQNVYSEWAQFRLRDVVALLRGEGPPLLPQVVGLLVLLLVNRSTAPERGVRASEDREQIRAVDDALRNALVEFADRISPRGEGSRDPQHFSLYGGYLLSEAARRLGAMLIRGDGRVYIDPLHRQQVVDLVARDLARRADLDAGTVGTAFDELVNAIRGPIGSLALQDSAFEQPSETRSTRSELLQAFDGYRARGLGDR